MSIRPDVDRAVIEGQQARLQRDEAANSASRQAPEAAARCPHSCTAASSPGGASRGGASRAAAPVRKWTADEKAFALAVLKKMCGGSDIRALDFLMKGRYDTCRLRWRWECARRKLHGWSRRQKKKASRKI
jgi:hypothetical protein